MINESRTQANRFDWLIRSFIGFLLIVLAYKIYRLFFVHSKLNDYLLSENLLHFEGGYIRRSLLGNFFISFPENYWRPVIIIFYCLLIIAITAYVLKYSRNIYATLFFFCAPFGIRMVMFDFGSMYRKETAFFLVIMFMIVLYKKYRNHTINLFIAILLSTLMVMVHESFVFLAMPVIAWIFFYNQAGWIRVGTYIVIMGIIFLILSGNPTIEQIQTLDRFFTLNKIDWTRTKEFMTTAKPEALQIAIDHFKKGSLFLYLIFFVPMIIYLFYSRIVKKELLVLFGLQMICCLALCLVAIDYGRWLTSVFVAFFICLISYSDLHELADRIRHSSKQKLLYVFLLLFMLSIYLPHYIEFYNLRNNLVEYSFWEKINYSFSELAKENQ